MRTSIFHVFAQLHGLQHNLNYVITIYSDTIDSVVVVNFRFYFILCIYPPWFLHFLDRGSLNSAIFVTIEVYGLVYQRNVL